MATSRIEDIERKFPWIKDWDPRNPAYLRSAEASSPDASSPEARNAEPAYKLDPPIEESRPFEHKCHAVNIRDALDALLKANFKVLEEDIRTKSLRIKRIPHRWFLEEGVIVYFICKSDKNVIRTNHADKTYGLATIVSGTLSVIEERKKLRERKEKQQRQADLIRISRDKVIP